MQGRSGVPLPVDRRPTDWERGTAGLAAARWITADMAYRRAALEAVGGFDERFPRAFREDADLALRVARRRLDAGPGRPVRRRTRCGRPTAGSRVRAQAGNADDVLMSRLHGRGWWARAQAPRGRLPGTSPSPRPGSRPGLRRDRRTPTALRRLCAGAWAAGTAEFALARILPGPRTREEVATMAVTSLLIPPAASFHWLYGLLRHRSAGPWAPSVRRGRAAPVTVRAPGLIRSTSGLGCAAAVTAVRGPTCLREPLGTGGRQGPEEPCV